MKRILIFVCLLLFCAGLCFGEFFTKEKYIINAKKHVLGVVVLYQFTENGYQEYLELSDTSQKKYLCQETVQHVNGYYYVRSLGTATIIANEQILTVWHVFQYIPSSINCWAYVYNAEISKPVEIVCLGNETDDYAILRFVKPQGFKGLGIAKSDIRVGEKVMWIGNGDCIAFNERYDYAGDLTHYFDRNNGFQLVHWVGEPYLSMQPCARGDSGTAVLNDRGEVGGIIYLGMFTDCLSMGMSRPVSALRQWLDKNNIKY